MATIKDINECYLNLGLTPGSSWEEIRSTYKKLAQINHPDRHEEGSEAQEKALIKFKIINESFQILSAHFQESADLELIAREIPNSATTTNTQTNTQKSPERQTNTSQAFKASPIQSSTIASTPRKHAGTTRKKLNNITLGLTLTVVFGFALYLGQEPASISDEDLARIKKLDLEAEFAASREKLDEPSYEIPPKSAEKEDSYFQNDISFTFGSSMTTVLSAQGIPPVIEGNTWIYGKSTITFDSNGNVSNWHSDPNNPLHTSLQ